MPPAKKPRACSAAAALGGELQLKVSRYKGRLRFYVQLVTTTSTTQPVWGSRAMIPRGASR